MIVKDRGDNELRCDHPDCHVAIGASFGGSGLLKSMALDSGWSVEGGKHLCPAHNPKSIRR